MRTGISILTMLTLAVCSSNVRAQWINSLTVLPVNPTSNDTITILADCSYPSAGCSDHTQSYLISGNDIYASTLHCVGVLTMICNDTDTFKIPPVAAGNYTFHLQVDAGWLPSPCTPGITPGATDSISFTVSPFTSLPVENAALPICIHPNPAQNFIQITGIQSENYPIEIKIFSVDGKLKLNKLLSDGESMVEIQNLKSGFYNIHINDKKQKNHIQAFIKQ